jgi:glycosyltransferase involved in cell wall biosynthesis
LPAVPGPRRIVFFGTYDERHHPRVQVLRQGLVARGDHVEVVNVPFDLDTAARVQLVAQPWRAPVVAVRLVMAWLRLLVRSRRVTRRPDAIVVGYLGHLDVHLARLRWPRAHLVLDHMVSLADTIADRRLDSSGTVTRVLAAVDRAATARADTVVVDTTEQAEQLPMAHRDKAVVVPVGAPTVWFADDGAAAGSDDARPPLSIVFFGLYTPLQGTPVIGEAIAKLSGQPISWTMIGSGQDRAACEAAAGSAPVRWLDWADASELPALVAAHDVCLGIFGTGDKARRVVPNKVFQGAATGCVIVTSDTPSQRAALDGAALFVPPGDAAALSEVIMRLSRQPSEVDARKRAARAVADERFTPAAVVADLSDRLDAARGTGVRPRAAAPPLPPNAALRWHLVRQRVDEVDPATILELGTGQGAVGARLAARARYTGVEPDPTSRAASAARLPDDAHLVADLGDLDADLAVDLACAFEVLEHIEDDVAALADWVARVRPGGHVLVSVPADPHRFGPFDELVGHLRRYSTDDLDRLFTAAGLEAVAIDHYGYPLGVVLEAGRNVIGKRRLAAGAAPDDVAARTAGSGRNLQPPRWAGPAIWAATWPFRVAQRWFPTRGPGLVGLARRPG